MPQSVVDEEIRGLLADRLVVDHHRPAAPQQFPIFLREDGVGTEHDRRVVGHEAQELPHNPLPHAAEDHAVDAVFGERLDVRRRRAVAGDEEERRPDAAGKNVIHDPEMDVPGRLERRVDHDADAVFGFVYHTFTFLKSLPTLLGYAV